LKPSLNLDLKTLEKEIEKELEIQRKRKRESIPVGPLSPASPPRLRSLTGGPCLSVPTHAPLPFLPLAVQWGRPVGASARYELARLCHCPVGLAGQSLPLLLQPLACADRAHARRDRRSHVATQLQTGTLTPSTSPRTPHFTCLAHCTSAHSPELRAPVLQARRSFPVARPPAPEFAAGRARPPSAIVLHHRYAQPRPHPCSTRGEFPRRTFSSLSPISSVPSISRR
jgi:hypothetical protein